MIAIGSYLVLIMSVMGTISAAFDFNSNEENRFYQAILNKHNSYRKTHGSYDLEFHFFPMFLAKNKLNTWVNTSIVPNETGVNTRLVKLDVNSKLNDKLANEIVEEWYKTGEGYNYDIEPTSKPNKADPFTRIVWNEAIYFGIHIRVYNDDLYVVAVYLNIDVNGVKYIYNVFKPSDDVKSN